jgi:O-antigen/teichoic acid export membrane protein
MNISSQYKPVVFRTILFTVINAGVGVIAALLSEEKGYARIMTCVAVNIAFGLSLFVYNYIKAGRLFKFEYAKFAIGFNLPLLLHYISQYILDQFDRVMIQKMVNTASAGIYSVAYNTGMLLKIITQSINNALVPWQYEKLEKKEFKELDDVLFLVYLLVGACSVIFSAFAPELMRILADDKYYEAVYAIPPVTLGLFFMYMYTTIVNVEFFYDRNKFTMYISMSGALLNIVLNYIGIKMFGYLAAAYTTMICYILYAMGHYIYMTISVKKLLGIDRVFNTKRIVALSIIVLFCGIVIMALYDFAIIRYILIAGMMGVGFYKRKMIHDLITKVKKK